MCCPIAAPENVSAIWKKASIYSQYVRQLPDMRRRVPVTGVPCVYQYGRTV